MPTRSLLRSAPRPVRSPWPVAGAAVLAALALLTALFAWAPGGVPAFVAGHPLATLLCLALLGLAMAVGARAWPRHRAAPAPARPPASAESERIASEWTRLVERANAALAQRGIAAEGGHWAPGTDRMLRQRGRPYLVCARHWRAKVIDGPAVRELALEIARRSAAGGMLLSASEVFTAQARQLARVHGITLSGRLEAATAPAALADRPAPAARAQRLPAHPASAPATAGTPAARTPPRLRDDQTLRRRPTFAPTVPMGVDELLRAVPTLRPDHEVAARRADFQPTVPMARGPHAPTAPGAPAPPPMPAWQPTDLLRI